MNIIIKCDECGHEWIEEVEENYEENQDAWECRHCGIVAGYWINKGGILKCKI